ncbi:MAG: hypothetical protein IKZ49_00510 [Alphaproteobacteria bacterium]|nr:hypothetical protein [Alphaproteobacteria bacterium]
MSNYMDIIFDRNQFTRDMLSTKMQPFFMAQFTGLVVPANKAKTLTNEELEQTIEFYSKQDKDPASANLAKLLYRFYNDPTYIATTEFVQYWKFIAGFLNHADSENIHLVLSKLSIFDDETQLKILKHVKANKNLLTKEEQESISIMVNKNPKATLFDKYIFTSDSSNLDLFYETIELLKVAIKEELSKDFPNMETIKNMCTWAKELLYSFKNKFPLSSQEYYTPQGIEYKEKVLKLYDFINITSEEFDINKILQIGPEHFARTTKTLEERLADAEKRAREAEQKAREAESKANSLETSNQQLQRNINGKDEEIRRKDQELSDEKSKNQRLTQQANTLQAEIDSKDNFLKTLKMKLATLKMGMFGNGKEFQTWLANELESHLSK